MSSDLYAKDVTAKESCDLTSHGIAKAPARRPFFRLSGNFLLASMSTAGVCVNPPTSEDLKYYRLKKERAAAAAAAAAADQSGDEPVDATEVVDEDEELLVRPKTPPQGSNYHPWTSYHDLPRDHPVFQYPAGMREKLYAKGVDPVMKAELDRDLRGRKGVRRSFVGRAKGTIIGFGARSVGSP
ncbi:hypothetical protein BAUCODRAFT_26396 [Baudoinia panamericana UAMH 10762]|uniref:Uncharacterized protein n=1 Tax=Baudoinia panamericana (strain UAMH 10762) TaxID=717646 RepID=M2MCH3_BAUPA|nr:uncharacterized protein BAUCODRAFT_26396 [Baudoinia panamericana UAMH 10762]EMC94221.1 hypothetical protein BAUCODRAFT_26396 [Baudoinia panamericana UAMH 10762]